MLCILHHSQQHGSIGPFTASYNSKSVDNNNGFGEHQLPIFIFLSASQIPSWLLVENELIWCIPSQEPFDLNNLVNPPLQTGSGLVSLEGPV